MRYNYTCTFCKLPFETHKENKKFCKQECYFASKKKEVTRSCAICKKEFTTPFRFRAVKTCGKACFGKQMSSLLTTRETKQCLACHKDFEVVQSYKDKGKYCSYECFLSTRKTRQPDVVKTCEFCKKEFTVPFIDVSQRFCNKSCARSGENNAMFGKSSPMAGKKAWNNGLTAKTDERVRALGEKISVYSKEQFRIGVRSNVGEKNPNYGNTADTLTYEKRKHFSEAAVKRVLAGVSGYKTGHVTGTYAAKKSKTEVKFKSSWELVSMMAWDIDDCVDSYEYEPEVIELDDGRRAIPDFFVRYVDGSGSYVEIKPTAIQKMPQVAERLEKVRSKIEKMGASYILIGNAEIDNFKSVLGKEFTDEIERFKSGS